MWRRFTCAALGAFIVFSHPDVAQAGKADDTLVWATDRENTVIDPYYSNTRELVILGRHVWDALVTIDIKSGEIKPLLSTSWKWLDDKTIEFKLRDGVKFHDGRDFSADDVVYTINFVTNRANGVVTYNNVGWMAGAEKVDAKTVRIKLKKPFAAALAYLANAVPILPKGNYDSVPTGPGGKKDFTQAKPVGTGPYKVVEVKSGEFVLMERFEGYIKGGPKGTPAIKFLRYRTIKEKNTQVAESMTGAIDWIWDVPKEQAERMKANPRLTVENAKTLRVSYLQFDVKGVSPQKFFMDKRIRQAIAHAINRDAIAKSLVGPASEAIHAACHPDQFGCTADVLKDMVRYPYDPEKAKKLLAEAGHPNGFAFDIYGYREREFTEAVIGDLAKVGIKAKLNWLQFRALREKVRKGEVSVNMMTWGSYSIPDASAMVGHFFAGGPDDLTKDPDLTRMVEEAGNTPDAAKRKVLYAKVHARIAAEAYWVPLFTYAKYYVYSKDLAFTTTSDETPRFYLAKWK
ncbi:MAG: ABC transporter substrate-binding protein [Hyphomicrobiaceae bacterium]